MSEKKRFDWIAACALVVAVLSLWFGIRADQRSAENARLSVRPSVRADVEYTEQHKLTIELRNDGLGPAVLEQLDFMHAGKTYKMANREDRIEFLETLGVDRGIVGSPRRGKIIPAGSSLLIYDGHILRQAGKFDAVLILNKARYRVIYRSFYEEEFELIELLLP